MHIRHFHDPSFVLDFHNAPDSLQDDMENTYVTLPGHIITTTAPCLTRRSVDKACTHQFDPKHKSNDYSQ